MGITSKRDDQLASPKVHRCWVRDEGHGSGATYSIKTMDSLSGSLSCSDFGQTSSFSFIQTAPLFKWSAGQSRCVCSYRNQKTKMRLHFASGVCLLVLTLSASVYSYKIGKDSYSYLGNWLLRQFSFSSIGAPLEVCKTMTPTKPHPGNISTDASPYVVRPTLVRLSVFWLFTEHQHSKTSLFLQNTIWSNESLPVIIESNTTPNATKFRGDLQSYFHLWMASYFKWWI